LTRHAKQVIAHIPRLRRYARALLRDSDRAEDLVQETLARALGRIQFWRVGSNLRAWLFSIMHNQYVNDCRRTSRQPDLIGLDQAGAEPAEPLGADSMARLDDVANALMQLPHQQRTTLLLVALEGLSYAETARVLGVQTGTVMSRLHRARERLRNLLDPLGDGVDATPAAALGDAADPSPLRRIK